ncbi:hypothetical protein N0V90_009849 [Kalmusia sp. IMI 367209]|nr:hypothetical protein N0V90_009849 [Kalmusia sp. IMI 367209]
MATHLFPQPPWLEPDAPTAGKPSDRGVSYTSTDFEFLNDTLARPIRTPASFHLFGTLPLELRRCIWEFSLPQRRLLQVTVAAAEPAYDSEYRARDDESDDSSLAPYQNNNYLGNIVSGANYHLHLSSTDIHLPLLYVNHEAKDVVHRVYRVRVPITQRIPNSNAPRLQFCPERDTVLINVERSEDTAYFVDFVHDALAYDPKKKGILHIAIMKKGPSIHLPIGLDNLHNRARDALAHTFKGLESVSLVHLVYAKCRQSFHSLRRHLIADTPQTEVVRFNRAYPLWASTASYSILPVDPRPVSRYLDRVDCGSDPCSLIRAWRTLEAAYDILPTSPERIRMLLATNDSDENILDIATTSQARWFRRREEVLWKRNWERWGIFDMRFRELPNPDNEEDLEFSRTQNAVGFWSVPLEAFGPVPDVPYDSDQRWDERGYDFTAFESQMELGLFEIA